MNPFKILGLAMVFQIFGISSSFAQDLANSIFAIQTVENMFDSVYALKAVRFEMFSKERMEGELFNSHAVGIMEYEPRKVFLRGFNEEGELQNEVLFIAGENNNNALISPNGFPFINLNLDPEGSTMRRNRHFTILEAGGRYLVDMLRLGMTRYEELGNMRKRFEISKNSETTYKVVITNSDFGNTSYVVKEGDDSRKIARELGIAEYKIVALNEEVSDYEDLEPGQTIIVPNLYAKRVELIIRVVDLIPIQVRIFDDEGLFSEYVYTLFDTNPAINKETFNSNNPAYTF